MGANYTYVDSRTTVLRTDPVTGNLYYSHLPLVSTSKNTWNATVFYQRHRLNTPQQGSANRPIQREFYGQTYQAGLRFNY